ncbi:chorismate mutase [Roseomonas sp. OT10]|uniref:chorismate mutase n=1 Tax=Roseomonas cutis TaxID=2897332 RepID=UPI001E588F52|nr:chorismate mutase [Roseomonas sp. OT10]UFN49923.1 chorismate mutase [Roseomonas sp. OT10]
MPDQPLPAPAPPDLATLRAGIDAIDDGLHDLLIRRAAITGRLAAERIKGQGGSFRPGREAAIFRRLLARHSGGLPPAALLRIWREIIASSLAQQGNFSVAVLAPQPDSPALDLARGHFGFNTPWRAHPTPARALAAVSSGEATVAVLPAPEEGEAPGTAWWPRLEAPRLQVVAALPFLLPAGGRGPKALVVAASAADPTGRDRSLLRLEHAPEQSRDALAGALAAAGLPPLRLILHRDAAPGPRHALAEVAGLLAADDPRLPPLRADLLGAFAEPETLP